MSRSRPIDKELFAAGLQCAKRLYLDFHHPDDIPDRSDLREQLAEVGQQMLSFARQAFPRGVLIEGADDEAKAAATTAALAEGKPTVLFDACFRYQDLRIECDILLSSGTGVFDLYEVKAGTRIKPRHAMDLAFQLLVVERCGFKVRSASILHVNGQYRHTTDDHRGAQDYPVQKLFKNTDVTARVRRLVPRVEEQLNGFRSVLADESTLELPTGTWCRAPIECHYLPRCCAEGPEHPLIELPELSRQQEYGFHEQAIESMTQVDAKQPGLTLVQRRALRAVNEGIVVVEPHVKLELAARTPPLHFLSFHTLLQVLPLFDGSRPWQHVPFLWSVHTLHKDGTITKAVHCGDGTKDPRSEFVASLASLLRSGGTTVVWSETFGERLREMLEDQVDPKAEIRSLLNLEPVDLQRVVRLGLYAQGLRGSFALPRVLETFGDPLPEGGEVHDDASVGQSFLRLVNTRTRAATRAKIAAALQEYADACSLGMLHLWQKLQAGAVGAIS